MWLGERLTLAARAASSSGGLHRSDPRRLRPARGDRRARRARRTSRWRRCSWRSSSSDVETGFLGFTVTRRRARSSRTGARAGRCPTRLRRLAGARRRRPRPAGRAQRLDGADPGLRLPLRRPADPVAARRARPRTTDAGLAQTRQGADGRDPTALPASSAPPRTSSPPTPRATRTSAHRSRRDRRSHRRRRLDGADHPLRDRARALDRPPDPRGRVGREPDRGRGALAAAAAGRPRARSAS